MWLSRNSLSQLQSCFNPYAMGVNSLCAYDITVWINSLMSFWWSNDLVKIYSYKHIIVPPLRCFFFTIPLETFFYDDYAASKAFVIITYSLRAV